MGLPVHTGGWAPEFQWQRRKAKSEIRSTKSETNPNTKAAMTETGQRCSSVIRSYSDFEFVSDFGFRISDLDSMMSVVIGVGLHRRFQLDLRRRPAKDALQPAA